MKKILIPILIVLVSGVIFAAVFSRKPETAGPVAYIPVWWQVQSVDTMKYSRDMARQGLKDLGYKDIIAGQVAKISGVGATHIAIDTPYDDEFLPYLQMWVTAARQQGLKIWFRGNWSGWEGWFGYSKITRDDHINKTKQFILGHPGLFADGDIFTACPECENGGPGSPLATGDVAGFRQFIIDEYQITRDAFVVIHKDVRSNFFSMNADVARQIMNSYTTALLGGIVTIDHYVKDPAQYTGDVENLAHKTGGRIMLGEFGAPIPDITGNLTPDEQARWLRDALNNLASQRDNLIGVNYWVSVGGTTQLWDSKGNAGPGAVILHDFFVPSQKVSLLVRNDFRKPLAGIPVIFAGRIYLTDGQGRVDFPYLSIPNNFSIKVGGNNSGFKEVTVAAIPSNTILPVTITPEKPNIFYQIGRFFVRLAL